MTQPGTPVDPYLAFRFSLQIAGVEHAFFTECTGLSGTVEVHEYKEGGLNTYSHKLPGRTTYSNVTLKRGMTDSTVMYDWFARVATATNKSSQLKAVSIIQYNALREVVRRYDLTDAFPVKWVGPRLESGNSAVVLEEFELAFADFEAKTS